MSILHVRNVPDDLYKRLRRRAEAQRRSLSAEVIILLTWAMEEVQRSPGATLEGIHNRRFFRLEELGAPSSTSILREDRER